MTNNERGSALVISLMAMLLLSALGLALVMTTTTETKIAANYTSSHEALYAADAAIERTIQDVLTVADWNAMLAGTARSAFVDGAPGGARTIPGGFTLNLTEATNIMNCEKTAGCTATDMNANTEDRPWGVNNPRWQLFAYGSVNSILPGNTLNSNLYLVVWVADDPSETDGDPAKDGNASTNPGMGVITLRAAAYGAGGINRVVDVTLSRTDSTEIERGYTGQRGQDEQNRRARKAAVQTPGGTLTRSELSNQ
jgi:Tfp pilus assembly protein PilX